ncbi:polysaccharide pyruvyl transferase family protein [Sphingobacterium oryzagri]|uniref:Polysaccharide pyruvyl transferase family protein n=1 Tax=Sphingobacterium oryzagri TaxID=3025669 RepID=A0ABY7WH85_9SPHI|nr:polysaccharide pyruvyl transferase family protein [Sphingobacterium sp. KACC 22765]WDF68989.1 polysaccharide pyruvyl transferase family protein [Sphingobacterium sp. KACC 22765]
MFRNIYKFLINNFRVVTKFQLWRFRNAYPVKVINDNFLAGNPTVHFLHRYLTTNTGDRACGYYQYFLPEFENYKCVVHDINNVKFHLINSEDIVIIGGGGLLNATAEWNYSIDKAAKIAGKAVIWSAGFNSKVGKKMRITIDWTKFDLISVRDFSYEDFRYVPCATCVMPSLQKVYDVKRKIGIVAHKDVLHHLPEGMTDYEMITNSVSLEDFVAFIGSSEIVLTNSYHAAYWSSLLKKKCVLFAPRSEKYDFYKYPPTLFSGNLLADINSASIYPNALNEAKQLTLDYVKDIKRLLETEANKS